MRRATAAYSEGDWVSPWQKVAAATHTFGCVICRPLSEHLVAAVPVAGYEPPPLVAQRFLPSHPLLPPTCDARQEDIGLNDVRERRTEFGIIFPFSSRQLGACSIEDFPVLAI